MNRTLKYLLCGIIILGTAFVAPHLWIQYYSVPIVVGIQRSLPAQSHEKYDRNGHSNNAALFSTYEDGISYADAPDKKITRIELSRIRRIVAWSFWCPSSIELIVVHNSSNVTIHLKDRDISSLYFTNQDGHWNYEVRRGHVDRLNH